MTRPQRTLALATPFALLLATLATTGCHIDTHKDGNNDNVSISTPFGGMHVKTNENADTAAIGLTAYPGAVPVKDEDGDKNTKAANIDMSFGDFHLGVKAASFHTADAPEKVIAFYRKDMARYGDVIECHSDKPVGTPTRTAQGLTCDSEHNTAKITHDSKGVHVNDYRNNIELRAGSEQHQHIVGIDAKDGGTKIGLVMLDLPAHLDTHNSKDSE